MAPSYVPIYISTLDCGMDNEAIINCSRTAPLGLTACAHSDDVYVHCEGMLMINFLYFVLAYNN